MLRLMLPFLVALSVPAHAGTHRDAVLDLLNAYEGAPTAEQLRAIDPGIDAELREIADDGAVPTSRRGRAISALGFFPGEASHTFLESRLAAADRSLLRRKAAMALATAFGAEAIKPLTAHLADDDTQVRMAVVRALASIDAEPAREALRARLDAETSESVRGLITTALGEAE